MYDYEKDIKPFLDECWKNNLNDQLLVKYKKILTPLNVAPNTKAGLSCPHCFLFGPKYRQGKDNGGVFIIGKETAGCGCNAIGWSYAAFEGYNPNPRSQEELMMETQTTYLLYNLEDEKKVKGKKIREALRTIADVKTGKEFLEANFIWDELIAMDYRNHSFNGIIKGIKKMNKVKAKQAREDHDAVKSYSKIKLQMELDLAKPKYAVFLIGEYAGELKDILDLSWEDIKPIGNKLNLTAEEANPEPGKKRVIKKQQINEFWWHGIHCFSTSHPAAPYESEPVQENGKEVEIIHWDALIAKKVWEFLAQEVRK